MVKSSKVPGDVSLIRGLLEAQGLIVEQHQEEELYGRDEGREGRCGVQGFEVLIVEQHQEACISIYPP